MVEKIKTVISAKDQGAKRTFKNMAASIITLNQGIELLGKSMRALSAPFLSVINEGREFGAQMSAVQAVTKATEEQFSILREESKRLGETTAFTATQSAKAMEELGRAGQTTTQIIETTGQALNLAAANGIELSDSAELLAIQMNIFKKEGLEANRAADLINQTISSSPQNFEQFKFAMQFAAQTASSFNRTFEETTQIIGALAETGVRGSMAGTALNMAFARLAKPAAEGQKVLEKYGISLEQVNPATREFADIIDVLNGANMKQSEIFSLLGQRTAPKFFKIIEAGGDAIREFGDKQKTANTALDAARTRLNNLDGDITIFSSALSGVKLTIFDSMNAVLRGIVQGATAMLGVFNKFVKEHQGSFTAVFEGISYAIDKVGDVIEILINTFGTFLKAIATFIRATPVLQEVLNNAIKTFDLLWDIVKAIAPPLWKLAKIVGGILWESWKLVATVLLKVANVLQKSLLVVLELVRDLIVDFPDHLKAVRDWFEWLNDSVRNFDDMINDLIASFGKLVSQGFTKVLNPIREFIKQTGLADVIASMFDETLTGNTLSISLSTVADELYSSGDAMEKWRRNAKAAEEAAKSLDNTIQGSEFAALAENMTIGEKSLASWEALLNNFSDVFTDVGEDLQIAFDNISRTVADMFDDPIGFINDAIFGTDGDSDDDGEPGGIDTIIGAMGTVTDVIGVLIDTIWSFFTANEKFSSALDGIKEMIGNVLAPIIEAFIPVLESITKTISDTQPMFDSVVKDLGPLIGSLIDFFEKLSKSTAPIIKMIIDQLIPLIKGIVDGIGPALINMTEKFGPMLQSILEFLVPVILELMPIISDILDLISELMPLIGAIAEVLKALSPIIKAIIRIIAAIINVIVNILKPIIQLITNVLLWIAELLTRLIAVIEGIFGGIYNLLQNLFSWIKDLVEVIRSLIAGFADFVDTGFGGGASGGGGKSVLDKVINPFGFAQGTGALTKDQLVRMPGMEPDAGLIKAHVGESVGGATGGGGTTININVYSINPREQVEEIRQILEELFLTGRLKVS